MADFHPYDIAIERQEWRDAHYPQREVVSITCRRCTLTSFHPEDVKNLYCGNCHLFHDPNALPKEGTAYIERTMYWKTGVLASIHTEPVGQRRKLRVTWTRDAAQDSAPPVNWRTGPAKWYLCAWAHNWLHDVAHRNPWGLTGGWDGWLHDGTCSWRWYKAWGKRIEASRPSTMLDDGAKKLDDFIRNEVDKQVIEEIVADLYRTENPPTGPSDAP